MRARELDPAIDVHTLLADEYPNFSLCGSPFSLSGEISAVVRASQADARPKPAALLDHG